MLVGYARVPTSDQNLNFQKNALSKADCQKIFEDKISGSCTKQSALEKVLELLREGDTLVV